MLLDLARVETYPAPFAVVFYVVIGSFWLSASILHAQPTAKTNRRFCAMGISVGLWVLFGYLSNVVSSIELALVLQRLNFVAVSAFLLAALLFAESLGKALRPWIVWVSIGIATIIAALSLFSGLVIESVIPQTWGIDAVAGKGMPYVYGTALGDAVAVIALIFHGYRSFTGEERRRRMILLIGIIAFTIANIFFGIVIPAKTGSSQLTVFGDVSAVFILLGAAYVAARTDIFNTRIASAKILAAMLMLYAVERSFRALLENQPVESLVSFVFLITVGLFLQRGIQREIVLRKENELLSNDLKERNKSLIAISEARKELLVYVSHQIRSPLASIRDYSDLLSPEESGVKSEKTIHRLQELSQSLLRFTSSLFGISDMGLGKLMMKLVPTRIVQLLQTCVREVEEEAQKKHLPIDIRIDVPEQEEILADGDQLKQAILNILNNAIQYTERGKIDMHLSSTDKQIRIEIEDTGMGMDENVQEHVFEAGMRSGASREKNREGMGVGLYLSKKIVELHSGTIRAERREGGGTRFTIELPKVKE